MTLTGSPADAPLLAMAQALVELAVGRTEAMATAELSLRDLDWLRRAVAYEAAWIVGQPDLFTRLDVTSLSQDGMSATFKDGTLVYGPLVKRALRKLSWLGGTRSVSVEPFDPAILRRRWPVGGPVIDYESEPWTPLGPFARR